MAADSLAIVERVWLPSSLEAINAHYAAQGWSDGLPIVPPTPQRVARMLAAGPWPAERELGRVPPRWAAARVADVAVCAVMAGCRPAYFPVVLTALQAALDQRFNLFGVQGTTNPVAPLIIVNGPIARDLDINSGVGLFGPGWPANATIGRALRLVLLAIGGGTPGVGDKSTLGSPAKYTYCIAENEQASPWPPLHVDRGLQPDASAVTVFAGAAPQNIIDKSRTPEDVLRTMGQALAAVGSNNVFMSQEALLVLGPEHARIVARAGWSKEEVRARLFHWARLPLDELSAGNQEVVRAWRADCLVVEGGRTWLRVVARPEDLLLVVAGGEGNHSAAIPGWYSRSVTLPLAG
jgi:hypothetical protein